MSTAIHHPATATVMIHPQVFDRAHEQWFILHTLSNQEKLLAEAMAAMDVGYFLPLRRVVKVQGRNRSHVLTPLFPSYVFMRGTLDDVYQADRTKRVAGIVRVFDQERLESEIRSIHMALINDAVLAPHPTLKTGIRVEVRAGPFRGMRGMIQDRTRDDRLILQVEVLGQATSLEIDGSLLEPV
jgi:transcription termination/antitermination protein NusG